MGPDGYIQAGFARAVEEVINIIMTFGFVCVVFSFCGMIVYLAGKKIKELTKKGGSNGLNPSRS